MKLHYPTLLLIGLLPFQLFSQSRISGIVTDKQSKVVVDFAKVYINGSTNGTLTDTLGNFHLDNVRFPCTVVFSHLSYDTHSIFLKNAPVNPLNVSLLLKINEISEVSILDKNHREQNLQIFKNQFLGTNVWGKYATIENEDVIQFSRDYKLMQSKVYNKTLNYYIAAATDIQWSADSTMVTYSIPYNLKAKSLYPLKINLPLLGYTLYYDLVGFELEFQPGFGADITNILGYSYYVPEDYESKRDSIRIQKNRLNAYYNSPQHFCKSLYENKLPENGYKLLEHVERNSTGEGPTQKFYYSDTANKIDKNSLPVYKMPDLKKKINAASLDTCIHIEGKYALLIGLKDQKFDIFYYSMSNNQPKDLTLLKGTNKAKSEIIFKMDTCMIRSDGTIPDNSIIFGNTIGAKKVGSMLPNDYIPVR